MRPPDAWITLASSHEAQQEQEALRTREVQDRIAAITARGAITEEDRDRLQILSGDLKWQLQPLELSDVAVLGRLAPSASRAQAEAEAASIATITAAARLPAGPRSVQSVNLVQANQPPPATILGAGIPVVLCGVILLILLACANVANLLLASAATRDREIATRLALGGSRGRIVRQLVTESVVSGGIGGVMGLLIANWLAPIIAVLIGFTNEDVTPDIVVYAFGVVATMAVALAASLAPARHSRRDALADALKTGRPGSSTHASAGRLRAILVGSQAAVSILLPDRGRPVDPCVCPGRHIRSRPCDRSSRFGADLVRPRVSEESGADGSLLRPTRSNACVRYPVSPAPAWPPMRRSTALATGSGRRSSGRRAIPRAVTTSTSPARGSWAVACTSAEEVRDGAAVVVITERLAKTFWGDENPIGSDMSRVWGAGDAPGTPRDWSSHPRDARVIGVIADAMDKLGDFNRATIYLPITLQDQRHASSGRSYRVRFGEARRTDP